MSTVVDIIHSEFLLHPTLSLLSAFRYASVYQILYKSDHLRGSYDVISRFKMAAAAVVLRPVSDWVTSLSSSRVLSANQISGRLKMQDWKMTDQITRSENAGPNRKAWKCRTIRCGTGKWRTRIWRTRTTCGYVIGARAYANTKDRSDFLM